MLKISECAVQATRDGSAVIATGCKLNMSGYFTVAGLIKLDCCRLKNSYELAAIEI